ncbi:MAG: hypothetical protein IH899_20875, partial [Planctomycetes bacterium]|nr:hypothetical protein [Planctomycetota bacterium]
MTGLSAVAWLATAAVRGRQTIYQSGPLTTPHLMFENDCAKCHDHWKTWSRLVSPGEQVSSVPNKKCMACHDGTTHQISQKLAHPAGGCSSCHQEHHGDVQLAWLADDHCTQCHSDLKGHGHTGTFARRIVSFEPSTEAGSHPEFAIHRVLRSKSPRARDPIANRDLKLIAFFLRDEDRAGNPQAVSRYQDVARIRFNHQVHLQARYGTSGKLKNEKAFYDKSGEPLDCNSCHQTDESRRFMQPIHFESHCARCHPLLFDNRNHPGETVPHETPEIVRGFLTEISVRTATAAKTENHQHAEPASRPFPGLPYRPALTDETANQVGKQVTLYEHTLFGKEAKGGCRYCHNVTESPDQNVTNPHNHSIWQIQPTRIPDRWYKHARFRHDSHRMLDCNSCHRNFSPSEAGTPVADSNSTGDVLIPPIQICRQCHTAKPPSNRPTGIGR